MKKKKNYTRTDKAAYFFLLPAAVIYLSVIVAPVCYSFFISLFKWNGIGEKQFVGLSNYINLFKGDKIFHTAIINNLIWIVLTIFVTMTIALLFAVILSKQFRGRTFFEAFSISHVSSHPLRWLLSGDGSTTPTLDLSMNFSKHWGSILPRDGYRTLMSVSMPYSRQLCGRRSDSP